MGHIRATQIPRDHPMYGLHVLPRVQLLAGMYCLELNLA